MVREVQLVGPAYADETLAFSAQDAVNWMPVADESGQARSNWQLRGVPGLRSISVSISTLRVSGNAPNGTKGDAYGYSYSASGGIPPYRFSVGGGLVPPGLSINATTGVLSGIAGFAGNYSFTVYVTDSDGITSGASDSISIFNPVGDPGNPNNPNPNNPDDPVIPGAITGSGYGGYINTPYYADAAIGEGLALSGSGTWALRSEGLPENLTVTGTAIAGYPTSTASATPRIKGGVLFGSSVDYTTTLAITASPSFTVWSPFDRNLSFYRVRFNSAPAPYLSATGLSDTLDGYRQIRALNGLNSGKRYWEIQLTALPASYRFAVGIDASSVNFTTTEAETIGDVPGQWGFSQTQAGASLRQFGSSTSTTSAVQGDRICCAADLTAGSLWIRVNGGAWIGGGDPATGASPTFSGLAVASGAYWGDFRPTAFVGDGVTILANFGSQAFSHAVPSGFSGWPWAQVESMRYNAWATDTMSYAPGDGTVYATGGLTSPKSGGSYGFGFSSTGANPSIFAEFPKSAGKWQFEVAFTGYRPNRVRVGLVDSTFSNQNIIASSFPIVGDASGSIGVLANSCPPSSVVPGFPAKVYRSGVEIGTFAEIMGSEILTFACDFTSGTVAIYRDGALTGTHAISGAGPWRIAMSGFTSGGARLITNGLIYPVASFADWKP